MPLQYTVHWEDGHLGVWLQPDVNGKPVISKLIRPLPQHFLALDSHQGSVGDILNAIADHPVDHYDAAIEKLKNAKLPLNLTFINRRDETPLYKEDPHARTYSLEWEENMKLGISFGKDPSSLLTIVSSINKEIMPSALEACHPQVGDLVLSIGASKVTEMKFHEVLEFVGHVEKPIRITFSQPPSNLSEPMSSTYSIEYHGEKLGIVFSQASDGRPIVKSSTSSNKVQVGDELISINEMDTLALGFKQSIEALTHVDPAKPVQLTFKNAPTIVDGIFDVEYHGGRLGLVLVAGPNASSYPVVEKVTDASTARGLELAVKGDELISVDGVDTKTMDFDKTVEMIKQVQGRTVMLRFHKATRTQPTASDVLMSLVGALFI